MSGLYRFRGGLSNSTRDRAGMRCPAAKSRS
jgi:hypothetical protein